MTSSSCFHGVAQPCLTYLHAEEMQNFFSFKKVYSTPLLISPCWISPTDSDTTLLTISSYYLLNLPFIHSLFLFYFISSPNIISIHTHHVFRPLDPCVYLFSIILPSGAVHCLLTTDTSLFCWPPYIYPFLFFCFH